MAKRLELQLRELIAAYEGVALTPSFPVTEEKQEAYNRAARALAGFIWQHRARIAVVPAGIDTPTYSEWKKMRE